MKKKFTEERIIKILNRNRNGESAKTLCRKIGISDATIYVWKKKFADMTVNEAKRFRELKQENSKLNREVAKVLQRRTATLFHRDENSECF